MIYMRGNPNDFNNWATLTKDPQWSYENLLPFFKKSENYIGNFPDQKYHGSGGPLTVSVLKYQLMAQEWLDAAKELGLNISDPNGYQTSTFAPIDATIKDGSRAGTYHSFLKPILNRPNLVVVRYAFVTKINLNSSNSATGVSYERDGQKFSVASSKEVILSAGAIGSPHLLMLSGIGPAAHLQSVGISPKVDLPGVGENLQDHVLTVLGPFLLNDTVSFIGSRDLTVDSAKKYAAEKSGPFSFGQVVSSGHFTTPEDNNPVWPNVGVFQLVGGVDVTTARDMEELWCINPETLTEYFKGHVGSDGNMLAITVALPMSRGTIRLQSNEPKVHPLIDPKYYSHPADIRTMIHGMKYMVKFYEETNAFRKYNATLIPKLFPGCEGFVFKSDEYYECYARHFTGTTFHQCCTSKMGSTDDKMAVVDSSLRVMNVKGLRVADTSIIPRITNANMNAPTIMIGEKAADIILKQWSPI